MQKLPKYTLKYEGEVYTLAKDMYKWLRAQHNGNKDLAYKDWLSGVKLVYLGAKDDDGKLNNKGYYIFYNKEALPFIAKRYHLGERSVLISLDDYGISDDFSLALYKSFPKSLTGDKSEITSKVFKQNVYKHINKKIDKFNEEHADVIAKDKREASQAKRKEEQNLTLSYLESIGKVKLSVSEDDAGLITISGKHGNFVSNFTMVTTDVDTVYMQPSIYLNKKLVKLDDDVMQQLLNEVKMDSTLNKKVLNLITKRQRDNFIAKFGKEDGERRFKTFKANYHPNYKIK